VLLEQVLANVMLNAVQAGATSLWVTLTREEAHLALTLTDNAGGITPAQMAVIFQPFRSSRQDGMGLGLVISQRLLRNIKGDIQLENQVAPDSRQGLRVTLALPRRPMEA
jgi:two-component system sensor histidine kinase TtrS